MTAHVLAVFLVAFIAGVAVAAVLGWVLRDRITERLRRRG